MSCLQCGRNALFLFDPDGDKIPLCLDCGIKFQSMQLQKAESHRREMNYHIAEFENSVGLPGHFPRYELARPQLIVNTGGVVLNNININNSQVGVVNTGAVEKIDASLTVLKAANEGAFAEAVRELTEAVISDHALSRADVNKVLELLDALSSEAVAPTPSRRKAVVGAFLEQIRSSIKAVGPYAELLANLLTTANITFGLGE